MLIDTFSRNPIEVIMSFYKFLNLVLCRIGLLFDWFDAVTQKGF